MAWEFTLLDASFKGVSFDVMDTTDEAARDVQSHYYPYVDGADQEDLGRKARQISMTAVFWGLAYEIELQAFLTVLNDKGAGELIHPVFGLFPQMQLMNHRVRHTADDVDYCTVALTFVEHQDSNPFFALGLASQLLDMIGIDAASMLSSAVSLYSDVMGAVRFVTGVADRLNAIRSVSSALLGIMRSNINNVVVSGQDIINFPGAFAADVSAVFDGYVGNKNLNDASLVSNWRELTEEANAVMELPFSLVAGVVPGRFSNISADNAIERNQFRGIRQVDVNVMTAVICCEVVAAIAGVVADVFADQVDQPTLSATEIESITNDVRALINKAIEVQRKAYPVEQSRLVTEPLKTIAWRIQEAAASIIEERPPLIKYRVDFNTNLHLLAHKMYRDYTRAAEILRLNPAIRNPNFILAGEVLNAYAK